MKHSAVLSRWKLLTVAAKTNKTSKNLKDSNVTKIKNKKLEKKLKTILKNYSLQY